MVAGMVKRSVRFSTQVLLMQLGVLLVVCGAGFGFMRVFLRNELIHQHEQRALSIARTVATDPRYASAIGRHDAAGEIQTDAEAVRRRTGALFVVVTDERGIRYSHPDTSLLGKPVATGQEQALDGREIATFSPSAAGLSARGKVPLRDATGKIVGQVIVAIAADRIDDRLFGLLRGAALFVGVALATGSAAAVAFTRRTKRLTYGLDPVGLRQLLEQQAALRRVATLVAAGESSGSVFTAVAAEVGGLLHAGSTAVVRKEVDGSSALVGHVGYDGAPTTAEPAPELASVLADVLATGQPAHREDGDAHTTPADTSHRPQVRSSIAAPIVVEGRLWGAIGVGARQAEFPPDTEQRIAEFTDLVAMAIANADSRAELTASRARVVAASDQTRRRIERDLHDGTQQRLVSLALELRAAEATVSPDTPALVAQMAHVAAGLAEVVEELQEMSRGIHPAILSRGGLTPALKTLARRSAVPVDLHLGAEDRLPEAMEVALYYVVSEALTNAAKHARAETVSVTLDIDDRAVHLVVTDDGVGGADTTKGSGLIGLRDRVAALGGRIDITSAAGSGTSLGVVIPLETG
ncbi:MAG: hypothetical protein QOE35_2207 [Actinomycetota bacterium]|jgi:signal transduction histidine kinase